VTYVNVIVGNQLGLFDVPLIAKLLIAIVRHIDRAWLSPLGGYAANHFYHTLDKTVHVFSMRPLVADRCEPASSLYRFDRPSCAELV
jgi:hypothetical protein